MNTDAWVNDVSLRLASRRIEPEPRRVSHASASFCPLCSRQFLSPEARALHVASSPTHPRCAPCDRRFLDARALANHLSGSRNHRQARSRRDTEMTRDLEAAVARVETTDVRPTPFASQQLDRGNSSSTSARRMVNINSFFSSDRPSTSELTIYARALRPSLARPTSTRPNAPVIHTSTAQQMTRTMVETRLSTAVPTVQARDTLVHRGEENEGRNDHSATRETSEPERSVFVSFFRSLWGWSDDTETHPQDNQNLPSAQTISTIGRSSETAAAEQTMIRKSRNDPEEGYKCPLCWDKKTHLSCLRCGHVFCTSCINQSLNVRSQCPLCRQAAYIYDLRRIYFSE